MTRSCAIVLRILGIGCRKIFAGGDERKELWHRFEGVPVFAGKARGPGIDRTPYGVITNTEPPAEPGLQGPPLGFPGTPRHRAGGGGLKTRVPGGYTARVSCNE